jgi:hypothetical protein
MEGDYWETWKKQLFPLLRDTQVQSGPWAGSWNPRGAVPDRWGLHAGRLYVTTMNLLSLEVEYRKRHLLEFALRVFEPRQQCSTRSKTGEPIAC